MWVTLSNALTSYLCDCSPFVTDEHDDHVAVAVLSGVLQPGGQVIEGVPPGDVIYKECSSGPPVVGAGNGSKSLLSRLKRRIWIQSCGRYKQWEWQTYGFGGKHTSYSLCPRSEALSVSPQCLSSWLRTPLQLSDHGLAGTSCLWTGAEDMIYPHLDVNRSDLKKMNFNVTYQCLRWWYIWRGKRMTSFSFNLSKSAKMRGASDTELKRHPQQPMPMSACVVITPWPIHKQLCLILRSSIFATLYNNHLICFLVIKLDTKMISSSGFGCWWRWWFMTRRHEHLWAPASSSHCLSSDCGQARPGTARDSTLQYQNLSRKIQGASMWH